MFLLLVACGNDNNEKVETDPNDETEIVEETPEDPAEEKEAGSNEDTNDSAEDQRDLTIGETGTFVTTIGTFEMTVEAAEIVGTELDGEESLFDELIVLDLTVKNVGDEAIVIEDIMHDMEITDDLEASGSSNGAEMFDSIELFEGELQPGEEKAGQFIGDIYTANEYYFGKAEGNVAAGTSNQVIWTIQDTEARNQ